MTTIPPDDLATMTGEDLTRLTGQYDYPTRTYRRIRVSGRDYWVCKDGTTVAVLGSIDAQRYLEGTLDQVVGAFHRVNASGARRQRLRAAGYTVHADVHGWQVEQDGQIVETQGYQGEEDQVPHISKPLAKRNWVCAWKWAWEHARREQR